MLGGLKAALGRNKSGPILPLSGTHVIQSGQHLSQHPPVELFSDRSSAAIDEEAPETRLQSPRTFCGSDVSEIVKVDPEAMHRQRQGTASTAYNASPPISGSSCSSYSPTHVGGGPGGQAAPASRERSSAGSETRVGLTQLVISLDLDILGPQGLLAQLGLPSQHELETSMLRVQCNGMEVHHRAPGESSRGSPGPRAAARTDASKTLPGMPGGPEQFYIGDESGTEDHHPQSSSKDALAEDFAKLFAAGASTGCASSSSPQRATGTNGGLQRPKRSQDAAATSDAQSVASKPSGQQGGGLASPPASSQPRAGAKRPQRPQKVPQLVGLEEKASKEKEVQKPPSRQETQPGTSDEALKELEELRRKNLRLQSDLYESLQAIEEDSISTPSSTPSFSGTPASSPLGGSVKALFRRSSGGSGERGTAHKSAGLSSGGGSSSSWSDGLRKKISNRGTSRPQSPKEDFDPTASALTSARYSDAHTEASAAVGKTIAIEGIHRSPPPPAVFDDDRPCPPGPAAAAAVVVALSGPGAEAEEGCRACPRAARQVGKATFQIPPGPSTSVT